MSVSILAGIVLASICLIVDGIYIEKEENILLNVNEDQAQAWAVARDTELILKGERLSYNYVKTAKEEVCYEGLGCFSKITGPFGFIDLNPETPQKLNNKFFLFSQHNKNNAVVLDYRDHNTLTTGFFDPKKQTVIISHGFNEDSKKDWMGQMKNLFLEMEDCNVIVADWGKGAVLPFYGQAIVNSELVARELSVILEYLVENRGLIIENVHGVGYSLGAHLIGFVGKNMITRLNRKIGRITGLDPAGPSFEDRGENVHLSKNDATFVDIIHSSAGTTMILGDFGIIKPIGHVDFYPNGGKNQPGCGFFELVCSHKRSVDLFIDSLKNNCTMDAYPCSGGYKSFKEGKCQDCGSGCGIVGISSFSANGRGTLYLTTKKASPFCID